MKRGVMSAQSAKEFSIPERCWILELSNDGNDEDVSIARARVEPGVTTEWHELAGVDERYVIAQGCGLVEIFGLPPTPVQVGDVVRIPAGTPQRITNTEQRDLFFFCICTPRFHKECYVPRPDLDWGRTRIRPLKTTT
jgi:mannose-6-phosphate isomerase-like protein (cupin superfamily)